MRTHLLKRSHRAHRCAPGGFAGPGGVDPSLHPGRICRPVQESRASDTVAAVPAPGQPLLIRKALLKEHARVKPFPLSWPVVRQLTGPDRLGRGSAVRSPATAPYRPRTADADRVVGSVCPYCAVGCAQRVYVKDEKVIQIEGDPDSPISRGRLCPKGSA